MLDTIPLIDANTYLYLRDQYEGNHDFFIAINMVLAQFRVYLVFPSKSWKDRYRIQKHHLLPLAHHPSRRKYIIDAALTSNPDLSLTLPSRDNCVEPAQTLNTSSLPKN